MQSAPIGVAMQPFEFAFLASYIAPAVKLTWEVVHHASDPGLKALPFSHFELVVWSAFILFGSLFGCLGILMQGWRSRSLAIGVSFERAGLFLFGAAITAYIAGVAELVGWRSLNQTLVSLVLLLAACSYKIMQLGQALESIQNGSKR